MKISVITATRNNAATLEATIKSVMQQTYNDIELIIVDGASTDNSVEIIARWQQLHPDKIKYVSEPDSGVYNAINKGIKMTNGDIIGTLHGNDTFASPDILSQVAQAMSNSDIDFVYGDISYRNKAGKKVRYYSSADYDKSMLRYGIAPPHPSLYARKEVFDTIGLYKENYLIAADFDFFIRLMIVNNRPSQYLPLEMVTMSMGGLSTTLRHRILTNNREKYRALRENGIRVCPLLLLKRYFYIYKFQKQ